MTAERADREDAQAESVTPQRSAPLQAVRNAAIVGMLSLALLEVALRVLGVTNPVLYERDPDVGYRLKPDQRVGYLFNNIAINAYGVRDPRPLDTRGQGTQRVVCLGDSVTWGGIYIRQEELFTSIAERKLGNVEVINAGVNGYSTTQMARLYEKYLTGLAPDLVVFCVIGRDFERPPVVQPTSGNIAFPERRPAVAVVEAAGLARVSLAARLGWDWLRTSPQTTRLGDFRGPYEDINVSAIAQAVSAHEVKNAVLVAHVPSLALSRERIETRETLRRLQRGGARVVDLGANTSFDPRDYVDGVHLSKEGHQKIGAALALAIYDALARGPDDTPEIVPEREDSDPL